ncbi:MAG: twin-arginine translocase TatA/TatE family subunit [Planctomycetia bacterium]|nr:twin-arginine translocase TatA/TatE family subunit [Planctomycetia bacterium]
MSPSPVQLVIILVIAFLLFGNRLPSVMRSLGRSVTEFKKGVNGIDTEVNDTVKSADIKASVSDKSEE